MLGWDPALIVDLGSGGNSWAISANNSNLIGGIDLLGTAGGAFGTLAALPAALLLREEGGDPSVVDEVDGATKDGEEDKVEEEAVFRLGEITG